MRPSTTQDKKSSSTRSSSSAQKPKSGGGRPGPGPTFVSKLYKMLSDTDNARLITWTPAGDAFVVLRPSEFARKLLPTQYKHSQFQSFVRQANMYGFSKVTLPSALLSQLLAVGEPSNPSTAGSTRPATNLPSPAIGRVRTSTTTTTLVTDASAMPPVTSDAGHAPTSARDVPHAEAAALAFAPAAAAAPAPAAVAAALARGAARGKATGPDEQPWAFKHPKFIRGAVDLLPEVRRKARVRKLSMTGVHAGGGGGGPPEGVDVGGHAGNVLLSPNQKEMGYRSGATDGESGGDDADAPSPGHAGGYGEYDELDGEQSMSMSLSAGGYYEPRHASMSAASGGNFSLHHTHIDRGTVLHESASPRPHLDMNLNDPLSPRPHSDPYAAAAQYPAAPYPAHQLALAALPPPPPPPAPRSAPIADQYAGQGATSAAMFRLAELTSKLADMVTRSLPPEDAADAASTAVRNEVTSIVSEAWGIANAFTGGDSAVGTAESATGSSADSPRAMRHHHLAWGYPSARPYRPASRAYPGYPSAGHYYGGVGGGPYARPPPYPPSARDAYLSPPYTAHPSFASRSPAEMYWPDPVHFPHSPSHPPAQFNGSSPAAAAQYAHQFPPSAGGAAAAAGAAAHAPLPAPARYHASPSAAVAAAGGPLSNLRYYSSAGTDGPDERGAEGERRQAPTAEDYELAMAQWH